MTKDEHIAELQRLADEAREAGDYTAAVEATVAIGRLHGFYVERIVIAHDGAAPDSTARAVVAELIRRRALKDGPGLSLVN